MVNAGIERVFSLVNKNKSTGSNRNQQHIKGLLTSILTVKMERPVNLKKNAIVSGHLRGSQIQLKKQHILIASQKVQH